MKAVVIERSGGPEVLTLATKEKPPVSRGEVLVNVKCTAINRADVIQRKGFYPAPQGVSPDIPGLEFAGVVEDVAEDVTGLGSGDRVYGLVAGGSYAEYVVVHARCLAKIPDNLDFVEAAAIPEAYTTAYDAMVEQCGLKSGETVLVSAVGSGVGACAVQIARAIGATSIGTSRSKEKLDRALELGMDHGILVKEAKFAEKVKELTGGQGADVVLELVGGDYFAEDLNCVVYRGRIIIVGLLAGRKVEVDLGRILSNRICVKGTTLRSRPLEEKILAGRLLDKNINPLVQSGKLKPIVDKVFDLEDVSKAHEYMEKNANFGKIILRVSK